MALKSAHSKVHIPPSEVHELLEKHILADGLPMVLDLEKSRGAHLYDSLREREVLDFLTCFATCPIGFNHPKLDTPEFRQRILLSALNKPSNSDFYTTEMAEFVATLSRTIPDSLNQKMFFIEGGALAVENALKTAFDWKVRRNLEAGKGEKGYQVIHFQQAFHGRSGYTLSLTNTADPRKTDHFPKFDWPRVSNPKLSYPLTAEILEQVELAEQESLDEIKRALRENRDDIAALIIEPIQGEGGDNHFRAEFLRQLRELADEEEFLLVFDEIQTGFGATGKWWAFEHFDVQPDIFAFGKKTQVCGICASDRIDDVDSVFEVSSRINSTWGGNLVDMVRCQRYVEIIEEDGLLENAATVGALLLEGLEQLETTFPEQVSNSRGRGMMVAFDLPDPRTRDTVLAEMVEVGVMALSSGVRAIRFRPPLTLTPDEAAEGLRRLELALQGGSR
jgi:L-lysine 6-transaminase